MTDFRQEDGNLNCGGYVDRENFDADERARWRGTVRDPVKDQESRDLEGHAWACEYPED
jgi:hypothetical protein